MSRGWAGGRGSLCAEAGRGARAAAETPGRREDRDTREFSTSGRVNEEEGWF